MEDCITADTVANAVRMLRDAQPVKKPIMIVEGESDRKFLENCIRGRIDYYPAKGKAKVLGALDVLKKEKEKGWFFALIDADYERLLGGEWSHDLAAVTALHDLECELLSSPALDKVVREYCSNEKCLAVFGENDFALITTRIRTEILKQGSMLGAIRFINARDGLGINFKSLAYESILEKKTIELNSTTAVRYLLARGGHKAAELALLSELEEVLKEEHEPWQICQGHDLVNLFLLGVRRAWGRGNVRESEVGAGLRLAYEQAFLSSTQWGKLILQFLS